jgi:hypothetical protein
LLHGAFKPVKIFIERLQCYLIDLFIADVARETAGMSMHPGHTRGSKMCASSKSRCIQIAKYYDTIHVSNKLTSGQPV